MYKHLSTDSKLHRNIFCRQIFYQLRNNDLKNNIYLSNYDQNFLSKNLTYSVILNKQHFNRYSGHWQVCADYRKLIIVGILLKYSPRYFLSFYIIALLLEGQLLSNNIDVTDSVPYSLTERFAISSISPLFWIRWHFWWLQAWKPKYRYEISNFKGILEMWDSVVRVEIITIYLLLL